MPSPEKCASSLASPGDGPVCRRPTMIACIRVAFVFYLICPVNIIGLWWAVGSPLVMNRNAICRKSRRLGGKQREMCRNEPEIVTEVSRGAEMAIRECQFQFRSRRWNCDTSKRAIGKVLRLDTREAAFLYAMTAAGVVHSVTSACSDGSLLQCSCDTTYRDAHNDGKWEWGGCNDNVNFGYIKSREFMDIRYRGGSKRRRQHGGGSDMRHKMLLHNNEAGRKAVAKYIRMVCKCHGLSGSCTLKTCWRKITPIRDTSTRIKARFDGAAKVTISNDGARLIPAGEQSIKTPGQEDLLYSMDSPDYCEPNKSLGSIGTARRTCEPDSLGVGGCDLLCCGRGYRTKEMQVTENCNCRFRWCCEVICQTCNVTKYIHRCRGYK